MSDPLLSSEIATPQIRAVDIRRSFRIAGRQIEVLQGVSLEIRAGECAFLVGASGAGKTTLLYTLAGMERPESGRVEFQGRSLYDQSDNARASVRGSSMGFVFQGYFLLPELTALENVMLPAMIHGIRPDEKATALLETVGLVDRLHHLPNELSGGEQQRVAIARAMINDPIAIYADEPTGNLDSRTGGVIVDLLLALTKSVGTTLVIVTHDHQIAERGDRKFLIQNGRLEMT